MHNRRWRMSLTLGLRIQTPWIQIPAQGNGLDAMCVCPTVQCWKVVCKVSCFSFLQLTGQGLDSLPKVD